MKSIAEQMEQMFLETLEKGDEYLMTWDNRQKHRAWRKGDEYVEKDKQKVNKKRMRRREEREKQKKLETGMLE